MLRKTKIICTLGPATEDESVLRRLMLGGMNAARFNFSHCTHEDAAHKLEAVVRLRDGTGPARGHHPGHQGPGDPGKDL